MTRCWPPSFHCPSAIQDGKNPPGMMVKIDGLGWILQRFFCWNTRETGVFLNLDQPPRWHSGFPWGERGSTERFLNEGCEEERPELVRYQKMLVWGGIFERISFMGKKIGANGFLWGESASAASSSHRNMKGWLPRLKSIREIIKRCYE